MGYGLFLARIVGSFGTEFDEDLGDRIQVKIIPQMNNIEDDKCPIFPNFFRDEGISGRTGELVWVISSNDFSIGYVLGPANYTTYELEKYGDYSIPKDLRKIINEISVKLRGESIDFVNVKLIYWDNNCIHFIRRSDGASIIAYRNGSLYIMSPNEFFINIGNSRVKISEKGISLAADDIKLQSKSVSLGENPSGSVVVSAGSGETGSATSKYVKA